MNENKIYIESFVSSTCLDKPARPEPFMIQENMKRLNLENPKRILKVDDTHIGIEEGKNAGVQQPYHNDPHRIGRVLHWS